jgi:hypothetical protein
MNKFLASAIIVLFSFGARAELVLSETYVDFGVVAAGSVVSKTITVTNMSDDDATFMNGLDPNTVFKFKGGVYPGVGGTCSYSLAAKASCDIVISYSPIEVGMETDVFEIVYFSDDMDQSVLFDVTGIAE